MPPVDDFEQFHRHYLDDVNLGLDFSHYSMEVQAMIRGYLLTRASTICGAWG